METVTDFIFSWPSKSLQMVTTVMKLKDACSLKKSYDRPKSWTQLSNWTTATNMCLHALVYINVFISLGYIPKSKITSSRQLCVQRVTFKELMNCFPKQLPYFTLSKAVCESLDFSNILINICLADFLSLFFLLGVKWFLIMVFTCISMMTSIFSLNLLFICISSLEKCLFRSFVYF